MENFQKNRLVHESFSETSIKIPLTKYINLNNINIFLRSCLKNNDKKSSTLRNRLIYFVYHCYRSFFKLFDKIYPYKKNYISKNFIPINIEKRINEYNRL